MPSLVPLDETTGVALRPVPPYRFDANLRKSSHSFRIRRNDTLLGFAVRVWQRMKPFAANSLDETSCSIRSLGRPDRS